MIAGLPGAGISALFYLIAVALMPFVALARTIAARRLDAGRWGLVGRQLLIGAAIVGSLVVGGLALGSLMPQPPTSHSDTGSVGEAVTDGAVWLGRLGVVLGLITLALVLGTVRVFAWLDRNHVARSAMDVRKRYAGTWSTAAVSRATRSSSSLSSRRRGTSAPRPTRNRTVRQAG